MTAKFNNPNYKAALAEIKKHRNGKTVFLTTFSSATKKGRSLRVMGDFTIPDLQKTLSKLADRVIITPAGPGSWGLTRGGNYSYHFYNV